MRALLSTSHESAATPERPYRVVTTLVVLVVALVAFAVASVRATPVPAPSDKPSLEVIGSGEEDATDRALFQASARTEDVGDPTIISDGPSLPAGRKRWTVMVYMVGSNLESRFGNATRDIGEMASAGVDYSRSNVIVYAGGTRRWQGDLPSDRNSVLDLSRPEGGRVVASTAAKADMGSAGTLSEFVSYATENYPAEHYALVLWDHGSGPLWGFGADESYRNDTLLLSEMRRAMDGTRFARGTRLDLVGFDACLMGSAEVASLWGPYADYLVASEELEPGDGWDYSALSALNGTDDPRELASSVVDAYGAYYRAAAGEASNPDVTLAAYDLSRVGDVADALGDLAGELDGRLGEGAYAELSQARGGARALGLSAAESRGEAYDLVDLASLCDQLGEVAPEGAHALADAVASLVVSQASNVDGLGGLSVYFPGDNQELYRASGEEVLGDVATSDAYRSFCNDYASDWLGDSAADWALPDLADAGDHYELTLTDEQLENLSGAYYTVLVRIGDQGAYRPVLENVRIGVDDAGVVRVPKDPSIICATTDEVEEPTDWQFAQVDSAGGTSTYRSLNTYLGTGDDLAVMGIGSSSSTDATISVSVTDGTSELRIGSVSSASDTLGLSGKQTVDVSDYDAVGIRYGNPLMPATDASGEALPWSQWAGDSSTWWSNVPLEGSFRFELVPVSTFTSVQDDTFASQLVLVDVNGGEHATGLLDLEAGQRVQATVSTDEGTLTFGLDGDHAEVLGYEGEDATLEVPAEVEGLPVTVVRGLLDSDDDTVTHVTLPDSVKRVASYACGGSYANRSLESIDFGAGLEEIGYGAFLACSSLAHADLPESVTSIGGAAFCRTALASVRLPSSLRRLGKGAFSGMQSLTTFEQEGENAVTSVREGVLFSADGSTLLAFPAGRGGGYEVPSGTGRIAYGAFAGALAESVTLPEGLTAIDNCGFLGCHYLSFIDLPESLQAIGAWAFESGTGTAFSSPLFGLDADYECPEIASVRIGPNVAHVGGGAFDGLKVDSFEVDQSNATYSSHGGFLCNKAGDSIVAIPEGRRGVVQVPDGVTTLERGTFSYLADSGYYGEQTDVILPDSAYRLDANMFGTAITRDDSQSPYFVHASSGSAAEEYAERYELPCDNVTNPDSLAYEDKTADVDGAELTFRVYDDRATLTGIGKLDDSSESGGTDDRLEIPAEFDGKPVTQLGYANGFLQLPDGFTTLVIPESVATITTHALMNITGIELSASNTSYKLVDGVLFSSDGSTLVRYTGDGDSYEVPVGTEAIAGYAFYGGTSLGSVRLPMSLRTIGAHAFEGCTSLGEVDFSEGLETIGNNAFQSCPIGDLDFPESLRTIGRSAFYADGASAVSISLPNGLENVGEGAFGDSSSTLTSLTAAASDTMEIGSALSIGDEWDQAIPFAGLDVRSFSVSEDNQHLSADGPLLLSKDGKVLYECASGYAGTVVVPEGVESIEGYAFATCPMVQDIVVPKSVSYLSSYSFASQVDTSTGVRTYPVTLHVPSGSAAERAASLQGIPYDNETDTAKVETHYALAEADGCWLDFLVSPTQAVLLSIEAIEGTTPGASLAIPSEVDGVPVTRVGLGGFAVGLPDEVTSLDVPGTVTTIDDNAFKDHEKLTRVTLHEGLEEVGDNAFQGCSLEDLSLPEGLRTVGDNAFGGQAISHANISGLTLPESLVSIGDDAINPSEDDGFYDLRLPQGLTSLGARALSSTLLIPSGNPTLAIGDSLTNMGSMDSEYGSFHNPFGGLLVTGFSVDEGNPTFSAEGPLLLSKDGKTLYACAAGYAGTVVIPDGVETIDQHAFNDSYFVTDIVFPASVTNLEGLGLPTGYDTSAPYASLHAPAGSVAETYLQGKGAPCDNEASGPTTSVVDVVSSGVRMSFLVRDGEATLYQCSGTAHDQAERLAIPASVEGAPVTHVGLHGQTVGLPSFVTSLEIPGSVAETL